MKDYYGMDTKEAIKETAHRIMENASDKFASMKDLSDLSEIVYNVSIGNDGSNICDVPAAEQITLTECYIAEATGSHDIFCQMVNTEGLSGAIYSAASRQVDREAFDLANEIAKNLQEEFTKSSKGRAKNYSKVSLIFGTSCTLDYFPPVRVVSDIEEYRKVEGEYGADVYRFKIHGTDFVVVCDLKEK